MSAAKITYQNALSAETAQWFAIVTRVKAEKLVAKLLSDQNIQSYVPIQKVTRIYSRKKRVVLLPLIYRYVFVKIKTNEYVRVLETPHVEGFVKFNKNLIAIPAEEIDWLHRVTGETQEISLENRPFSAGDEVRVVYGNLTGMRGKLIQALGKNELLIELETIGIGLRIQIDPTHLELIAANKYKITESSIKKSKYAFSA